jgi:hypothetical protein
MSSPNDWVTREEAFEVSRLLSSLEESQSDGITVDELAQLLHVSPREAQILAGVVRQRRLPPHERKPRNPFRLRLWYFCVSVFTVYAVLQCLLLLGKTATLPLSTEDRFWLVVLGIWSVCAIWYYRQPIKAVLVRFLQGHGASPHTARNSL